MRGARDPAGGGGRGRADSEPFWSRCQFPLCLQRCIFFFHPPLPLLILPPLPRPPPRPPARTLGAPRPPARPPPPRESEIIIVLLKAETGRDNGEVGEGAPRRLSNTSQPRRIIRLGPSARPPPSAAGRRRLRRGGGGGEAPRRRRRRPRGGGGGGRAGGGGGRSARAGGRRGSGMSRARRPRLLSAALGAHWQRRRRLAPRWPLGSHSFSAERLLTFIVFSARSDRLAPAALSGYVGGEAPAGRGRGRVGVGAVWVGGGGGGADSVGKRPAPRARARAPARPPARHLPRRRTPRSPYQRRPAALQPLQPPPAPARAAPPHVLVPRSPERPPAPSRRTWSPRAALVSSACAAPAAAAPFVER